MRGWFRTVAMCAMPILGSISFFASGSVSLTLWLSVVGCGLALIYSAVVPVLSERSAERFARRLRDGGFIRERKDGSCEN